MSKQTQLIQQIENERHYYVMDKSFEKCCSRDKITIVYTVEG